MAATQRTYYDLLDIDSDAKQAEIRKQWKLMLQAWHPDRFPPSAQEHAKDMSKRINEAWQTLKDEQRRAAYDEKVGLAGHGRPADPSASAPPPHTQSAQAVAATPPDHSVAQTLAETAQDLKDLAIAYPRIALACAGIALLLIGLFLSSLRPPAPMEFEPRSATPVSLTGGGAFSLFPDAADESLEEDLEEIEAENDKFYEELAQPLEDAPLIMPPKQRVYPQGQAERQPQAAQPTPRRELRTLTIQPSS